MTTLRAYPIHNDEFGHFQILATTPSGKVHDLTMFRGVPAQVSEMSTRDPFGDAACTISFPQVTVFDREGQGDLSWLVPYTNIDIRWVPYKPEDIDKEEQDYEPVDWVRDALDKKLDEVSPVPGLDDVPEFTLINPSQFDKPQEITGLYTYPIQMWKWEGYIATWEVSSGEGGGLNVTCKGALYQLDNYLAKPEYPRQPIPYELLIKRSFNPNKHPGLRTQGIKVVFPDNWHKKVPESTKDKPNYLVPYGVKPGDDWTGLTSRSTGAWDNTLTGFVQGLLSVMFTDHGRQWTIYKLPGRKPILVLRREPKKISSTTLVVSCETPGVDVSITRDFTQSVNLVYGQGKDIAGISFSGQQVAPNGGMTYYEPFASAPQVYPPERQNRRYNPKLLAPKEGLIQFPQGLSEEDARAVAEQQFRRFADPGYTGTITLKVDPTFRGRPFPRYLIQAGQSIALKNLLGKEHVIFHIVESSINVVEGTATLSVDSKFRDHLTWQEVRARTRDALIPLRSLQVGQYSNTIQDLLKPWSYRDGSGVIPSGADYDATEFFNKILPKGAKFPYEEWTQKHPPSHPASRKYYIKVGPWKKNDSGEWDSRYSWGTMPRNGQVALAIPVKASQLGSIRLTQIAAYDRNGNVKPVKFHVSLYTNSGTGVKAMPRIPDKARLLDERPWQAGQYYPFFKGAFEKVNRDGTQIAPNQNTEGSADIQVGWGNYFEPAGFWPGLYSAGDTKTGMLVDETSWSYDCSSQKGWDLYDQEANINNPHVGVLYIMIYCDDDRDDPTFFMGRLFREEPGTS